MNKGPYGPIRALIFNEALADYENGSTLGVNLCCWKIMSFRLFFCVQSPDFFFHRKIAGLLF